MSKVLYGVQGDGMGHSLRSKPIIDFLISEGHEVKILGYNKSYNFFKDKYDISSVYQMQWEYRKGKVSPLMTVVKYLINFPQFIKNGVFRTRKIIKDFDPDYLITDLDSCIAYAAILTRKPLISIDNVNILRFKHLPIKITDFFAHITFNLITRYLIPTADRFFITTFSNIKIKNKKVTLIPPIIRQEIIDSENRTGDHIMVYQTSFNDINNLLRVLSSVDEKVKVYGVKEYGKKQTSKNIEIEPFCESKFVSDLASCKAVIINGGFTLMSEAIYLEKPILSSPLKDQYEQKFNALMLEKDGFGMYSKKITKEAINKFISNLEEYRENLNTQRKLQNNIFDELRSIIK